MDAMTDTTPLIPDEDAALDVEVARRTTARGLAPSAPEVPTTRSERSRVAHLASRLYAGASAVQRSRLVATLLRPLGPLALVAVASGAFAGLLTRLGSDALAGAEELAGFTTEQVFELARFVEQVSPEALQQAAGAIADNPVGVSTRGAAAAVLLAAALRAQGVTDLARGPRAT